MSLPESKKEEKQSLEGKEESLETISSSFEDKEVKQTEKKRNSSRTHKNASTSINHKELLIKLVIQYYSRNSEEDQLVQFTEELNILKTERSFWKFAKVRNILMPLIQERYLSREVFLISQVCKEEKVSLLKKIKKLQKVIQNYL